MCTIRFISYSKQKVPYLIKNKKCASSEIVGYCKECKANRPEKHAHWKHDMCNRTLLRCDCGKEKKVDIFELFSQLVRRHVESSKTEKPVDYIFGTLSFGCTFCGGSEEGERHRYDPSLPRTHVYRSPGRQIARKKLETWLDDIAPPIFNIEAVYHAEEFGSANGRIHHHFCGRYSGTITARLLNSLAHRWSSYGFSRIERMLSFKGQAYISKTFGYVSKGQQDERTLTPISFIDMIARGDERDISLSSRDDFARQLPMVD